MDITDALTIPDDELHFSFARSGGPGGQNVNKMASKALLHWNLAANTTLPADVRERLRLQQANRLTAKGDLVLQSQRFRDQARNPSRRVALTDYWSRSRGRLASAAAVRGGPAGLRQRVLERLPGAPAGHFRGMPEVTPAKGRRPFPAQWGGLVRAEFILGEHWGADRVTFKR
jgi:hypothetical protein